MTEPFKLDKIDDDFGTYWRGRFKAMGSPCEVLVASPDQHLADQLIHLAQQEALRIEHKFSRYRDDNIIHTINQSDSALEVDDETANLLDFADQCYQLSEGLFDVSSGVLREVWTFDGSDHLPEPDAVNQVLQRVGWSKIKWNRPIIELSPGMQIDLGGIGKEYAVDQVALKLKAITADTGIVVNFGGDLVVTAPRSESLAWSIGVDDPARSGQQAVAGVQMRHGAMATSGDARRYLLKDGVRYSHILNPQTGWPVSGAPRSVTVLANTCIEAGMLATFAMLQGELARAFLDEQEVDYWLVE